MDKFFSSIPTYKFDKEDNNWISIDTRTEFKNRDTSQFSIITYNVLFSTFENNKEQSNARVQKIIEILNNSNADIIGLQEVTQSFLIQLLREDWVKNNYYVSDSIQGTTVNPYGQLLLSKFPFKLVTLKFSKFKRVIIGEFALNGRCVFVPVLHLTSDKSKFKLDTGSKRSYQLKVVYDKTCPEDNTNVDCIMIGDFNLNKIEEESEISSDFQDVWKSVKPSDPGYTFDPTINYTDTPGAAARQRRYDRIYVRSLADCWTYDSIEMIGKESFEFTSQGEKIKLFASDHFGLLCYMSYNSTNKSDQKITHAQPENNTNTNNSNPISTVVKEAVQSDLLYSSTLGEYLRSVNAIETEAGLKKRESAIQILDARLKQFFDKDEFKVLPLGSYQLGVVSPSTDMDMLCISVMAQSEFFLAMRDFMPKLTDIKVLRRIEDAVVPILKLDVQGVKVDLLYIALSPQLVQTPADVLAIGEMHLRKMDKQSHASLAGVKDTEVLMKYIPNLEKFRLVAHLIRRWAKKKHIYSSIMGYLGGISVHVMVTRICQLHPDATPEDLIYHFFNLYSRWSWLTNSVSIITDSPIPYKTQGGPKARDKEWVPILTPSKPYKNITRNATRATSTVIQEQLKKTFLYLERCKENKEVIDWNVLLSEDTSFFNNNTSFIQITISAINFEEFALWSGWIESRIVNLVATLEQNRDLRITPLITPYKSSQVNYPFSVVYFIGLKLIENARPLKVSIVDSIHNFDAMINNWALRTDGMALMIKHVQRDALKVDEQKRIVQ